MVELLVVIAILSALMAMLFPVLKKVQARSKMTSCINNLKQLGVAVNGYATSHDGRLPTAKRIGDGPDDPGQISNIIKLDNREGYHCPADTKADYDGKTHFDRYGSSYEWQTWANNRLIENVQFEVQEVKIRSPIMSDAEKFHGELGKNFLYEDGSVGPLKENTVE